MSEQDDHADDARRIAAINCILDELDLSADCGTEWMGHADAIGRIAIVLNREQAKYMPLNVPTLGMRPRKKI